MRKLNIPQIGEPNGSGGGKPIPVIPSDVKDVIEDISGVVSSDGVVMANAIAKAYCDTPSEQIIGTTPRTTAGGAAIKDGVAFVDKVKGNTFVLNQQIDGTIYYGQDADIISAEGNEFKIRIRVVSTRSQIYFRNFIIPIGHKCIQIANFYVESETNGEFAWFNGYSYNNGSITIPAYTEVNICSDAFEVVAQLETARFVVSRNQTLSVDDVVTIKNPMIIDLTQMFGAGNEPETVEEFKARLGIPADGEIPYIPYNEGELVSLTADKVVSKSRNLWDEEWEIGLINSMGANGSGDLYIRSKNYIPVKPDVTYVLIKPQSLFYIAFYDENYVFIVRYAIPSSTYMTTSPNNARYARFCIGGSTSPITSYSKNICICENGTEYTSYFRTELHLNISDIKDSEGNVLFPNGLCSAGDAHDEIDWANGKAIKRVGAVDMGTLGFAINTNPDGTKFFSTWKPKINRANTDNIVTTKYTTVYGGNGVSHKDKDKVIFSWKGADSSIIIQDSSYNSNEQFREYLSGQILYYELLEPIVIDIPKKKSYYKVSNGGTEQIEAQGNTSPMKADIGYRSALSADEITNANNLL